MHSHLERIRSFSVVQRPRIRSRRSGNSAEWWRRYPFAGSCAVQILRRPPAQIEGPGSSESGPSVRLRRRAGRGTPPPTGRASRGRPRGDPHPRPRAPPGGRPGAGGVAEPLLLASDIVRVGRVRCPAVPCTLIVVHPHVRDAHQPFGFPRVLGIRRDPKGSRDHDRTRIALPGLECDQLGEPLDHECRI